MGSVLLCWPRSRWSIKLWFRKTHISHFSPIQSGETHILCQTYTWCSIHSQLVQQLSCPAHCIWGFMESKLHPISDPTYSLFSCTGGSVEALWILLFCCTTTRLKGDRLRRIRHPLQPPTLLCGITGLAMIWLLLCNLSIINVNEVCQFTLVVQSQDF